MNVKDINLKEAIDLINKEIDKTIKKFLLGEISKKECMAKTGYADQSLKNIKYKYEKNDESTINKYFGGSNDKINK